MERGLFRGNHEGTAHARYELVDRAFNSPLLETPEDVANAVWKAVKHRKADVLVGSARLWTTLYHTVPGLMNPIVRRIFGMSDRHSENIGNHQTSETFELQFNDQTNESNDEFQYSENQNKGSVSTK